jgi:hypothetical protein
MVHDRVADEHAVEDILPVDAAFRSLTAWRTALVIASRPSGFIIT